LITLVLVNCEGFASDGRLIDLEKSVISDNAAICRDDGALDAEDILAKSSNICEVHWEQSNLFNLKNVTRDNLRSLNFK
jgi:hypothetical protein